MIIQSSFVEDSLYTITMSQLKILADFQTTLAASVAVGATTATLTSATDSDGVALPAGNWGFTLDVDETNKEYISADLSGTALTNIMSISRQGVSTSGIAQYHRKGATVTVTDWAALSRIITALTTGSVYQVVTLTDAATIATNASLGNIFDVTLGGNRTLGAPTNPTDGQVIEYRVQQDGTGNRTLAYNAMFGFTADVPSPTLSTAASKIDFLLFQYKSAQTKWFCLAVNKGAN